MHTLACINTLLSRSLGSKLEHEKNEMYLSKMCWQGLEIVALKPKALTVFSPKHSMWCRVNTSVSQNSTH